MTPSAKLTGDDTTAEAGSLLDRLLRQCIPASPGERSHILESSTELEEAYASVASKGVSAVPDDPEEEVDFHYLCLTSSTHGYLYELDGDTKGPFSRQVKLDPAGDVLGPRSIACIKSYIDHEVDSIGFNLMVLIEDRE